MTKEAAPKAVKEKTAFKPSEDRNVDIPLVEIVSNSQNPRESAPQLLAMGYGLFSKLEGSDKAAVVPLAIGSTSAIPLDLMAGRSKGPTKSPEAVMKSPFWTVAPRESVYVPDVSIT